MAHDEALADLSFLRHSYTVASVTRYTASLDRFVPRVPGTSVALRLTDDRIGGNGSDWVARRNGKSSIGKFAQIPVALAKGQARRRL